MGGSQTIVMPNGQRFDFNDKEYYSGRRSKYNSSIRHDLIGDVIVSKKEVAAALKIERERAKMIAQRAKEAKAKDKRILEAKNNGVYSLLKAEYGTFIELSDEEERSRHFDAKRLAATLKIAVADAELLNSEGKTYVFASSEDGCVYELYHADLSVNYLSIHVSRATTERILEFKPSEWQSAPYADRVGQTHNSNHLVC